MMTSAGYACGICGITWSGPEQRCPRCGTPGDNIWVKVPSSLEKIIANSEERVLQRLYDILIESLMVNHGDLQGITVAFERFNAARQRFEWAKKLVLDNEQR